MAASTPLMLGELAVLRGTQVVTLLAWWRYPGRRVPRFIHWRGW